jgi:hypothetical protein
MLNENVPNDTSNTNEQIQNEIILDEEALSLQEEIFKSRFPMKVSETYDDYVERVATAWILEKQKILQEKEGKKESIDGNVEKWLQHPLIETYARRYQAGEKIEDLLQGQINIDEKTEAIKILTSYFVSEAGVSSTAQNEEVAKLSLETENKVQDEHPQSKAYTQAQKYIQEIQQNSKHPEMYEKFIQEWQDPTNTSDMITFLLNNRYKEYREVAYPQEPDYDSVFEFACTDDTLPHIKQNGWIYRGNFPKNDIETKTRGSLNIHISKESINDLDALITLGVIHANYKFGEPDTRAEASERHDAITLYFLEQPTKEAEEALTTLAQKYYRGGSLLGKEIAPGFSMSEIASISENQIGELLLELHTKAPELEDVIRKYVVRTPKEGQSERLAMSEAQYYAIRDTLALCDLHLSLGSEGEVLLEKI